MNDAKLYEKLGRKQELLEAQDEAYQSLLNVFAGVVSGAIDPTRILVNLTDRNWIMAPKGMSPEMPATINGLPNCVTAPAPKEPEKESAKDGTA